MATPTPNPNMQIELPEGLCAWPHLDAPFVFKGGDARDAKYSVTVYWPEDQFREDDVWKGIRKAMHAEAVRVFGAAANPSGPGVPPPYQTPFRIGSTSGKPKLNGWVTANLASKYPISCADLTGPTVAEIDPGDIKFGQRVITTVAPNPNDFGGQRRVTLYLKFVGLKGGEIDSEFVETQSAGGGGSAVDYFAGRASGGPAPAGTAKTAEAQAAQDYFADSDDIPF